MTVKWTLNVMAMRKKILDKLNENPGSQRGSKERLLTVFISKAKNDLSEYLLPGVEKGAALLSVTYLTVNTPGNISSARGEVIISEKN